VKAVIIKAHKFQTKKNSKIVAEMFKLKTTVSYEIMLYFKSARSERK